MKLKRRELKFLKNLESKLNFRKIKKQKIFCKILKKLKIWKKFNVINKIKFKNWKEILVN